MRTFMTAALGICLLAGMAFTAEAGETKAKMEKAKGEMKADAEEMKGEMKGAKEEMKGNDTKAAMERAKGDMKGAGERTKGKMKEMKEKMKDYLGRHPPRRGTAGEVGRPVTRTVSRRLRSGQRSERESVPPGDSHSRPR